MGTLDPHFAISLGLLLGACLGAGVVADLLHLPKVTAYLLDGLLVGHSTLDLIPEGHVKLFQPVLKLAMAVVLFNLGCEFTFTKVRRVAARCLALSVGKIVTTCGVGTVGLALFGCPGSTALVLGCLAVATALATHAFELLQAETDDCIPVISREEPHKLLGVVRRSDVMQLLITQHRNTK